MSYSSWAYIGLVFVVILVVFLALLAILLAGAVIFGRKEIQKRIYKYLKPDPSTVQQDLDRLRLRFPNIGVDEIAVIHVKEEAQFLAWVGVLTIIPILGFLVDISYTTLRQMRMLHVITALYQNDRLDPEKLEIKYMGIVGGVNLVRFLVKGTTSDIPFGSAVINALLNWFFTKQIGNAGIALSREQSLWETAKEGAGEMAGRLLAARDSARDAVNRKSVGALAVSQLDQRVIPASQLPVGHTEFTESHAREYAKPVPISVKLKVCPTCGNSWANAELFCAKDGTPLPVT